MKSIDGGVAIDDLLLDPLNPRLPDDLLEHSQEEILSYLYDNDVLEELAESIVENGYFENEPIIVLTADKNQQRIVAEGNRRLATVMILTQSPVAQRAGLRFDGLPSDQVAAVAAEITHIPAFEVSDRRQLAAYLGFRHINGIRTWGAYEKARYVAERVREARDDGESAPFTFVGRLVGGNARGVRNSYVAFMIVNLPGVREIALEQVRHVTRYRFAVWLKLLGTRNIPDYISLSKGVSTLDEVNEAISSVDHARVVEVLKDLAPGTDGTPPILTDSRLATAYSEVIIDKRARAALRSTENLTFAMSILQKGDMESRVRQVNRQLDSIMELVGEADSIEIGAMEVIERLARKARNIRDLAINMVERSEV